VSEAAPHYLLITVGSAGDVHPFMYLAKALRAMGREVTLITHSYHARLVESAGFPFVALGNEQDYLKLLANPDLWHPKKAFAAFMANYRELIDQINLAISSVTGQGTRVAIVHPFAVPAADIARERGFLNAIVGAYLAPSNLRTCYDPLTIGPTAVPRWVPMRWRRALWRFIEKGWIDPVAVAQMNAARAPHGLPEVDSLLSHIAGAPDLSVTLFPAWFAPPVPDWPQPMLSGDFPLFDHASGDGYTAELSAFLAAGDKPIVFTAGTANFHAAQFFAHALAAANRLGKRAVFLTRERAQLPGQLPASVLWQSYVPLSKLLPHCAAMVHHGGIGTTAEALRAGVPQLITPFAWDQFDNGARVASLGAGLCAPVAGLGPRKLARKLDALITSDSIRTCCAQIAAQFVPAYDPTSLCRGIERQVLPQGVARAAAL
jgi:rhamnosyltransferase subunit B